jgi:hypothetical protein
MPHQKLYLIYEDKTLRYKTATIMFNDQKKNIINILYKPKKGVGMPDS